MIYNENTEEENISLEERRQINLQLIAFSIFIIPPLCVRVNLDFII